MLPKIYLAVNFENVTVIRLFNLWLYGRNVAGIVTAPSKQMIQHASVHYASNLIAMGFSAIVYPSIAIGLSYWLYSKLKSSLKGRIREWHS